MIDAARPLPYTARDTVRLMLPLVPTPVLRSAATHRRNASAQPKLCRPAWRVSSATIPIQAAICAWFSHRRPAAPRHATASSDRPAVRGPAPPCRPGLRATTASQAPRIPEEPYRHGLRSRLRGESVRQRAPENPARSSCAAGRSRPPMPPVEQSIMSTPASSASARAVSTVSSGSMPPSIQSVADKTENQRCIVGPVVCVCCAPRRQAKRRPARRIAAPAVGPVVGQGRQELVDQKAVRRIDLEHA